MFIFVKLNKYAWGAKLRESLFLLWFYLEKSIMNFIFLLISHYNVYTVWLMLINDVLKCCKTYWLNVPHSNSIFMYSSLLYYSHWYTMILYIAVLFFMFYSLLAPLFGKMWKCDICQRKLLQSSSIIAFVSVSEDTGDLILLPLLSGRKNWKSSLFSTSHTDYTL